MSACILHNICIENNDILLCDLELASQHEPDLPDSNDNSGLCDANDAKLFREILANHVEDNSLTSCPTQIVPQLI